MKKLSSRKFWIFVCVAGIASVMLVCKFIDQKIWQEILIWGMGLYFGVNVGDSFIQNKKKEKPEDPISG